MITEKDLQEAIAECQGQRNPNANTCIKLAAYYIIRNEMYPEETQFPEENSTQQLSYSYAGEPTEKAIDYKSGTEFSKAIDGRWLDDIFPVLDELMTTLEVLHPRLYDGVMRQLNEGSGSRA